MNLKIKNVIIFQHRNISEHPQYIFKTLMNVSDEFQKSVLCSVLIMLKDPYDAA